MADQSGDPIAVQDEILQVLYWMRGEKLGDRVTLGRLSQFLQVERYRLEKAVKDLVEGGLVDTVDGPAGLEIRLSLRGVNEGKRRFEEEFDSVLGHESHLVCDDPNCDCHSPDRSGHCLGVTRH